MKTFRELISWELEQESKQKAAALDLSKDHGSAGNLSASMLRKIRYLSAHGSTGRKAESSGFSTA